MWLQSLVPFHVFLFSYFLIPVLHFQVSSSDKMGNEVHDPLVGLFPVPDEFVSAAQSHHGDCEDEWMDRQEKLNLRIQDTPVRTLCVRKLEGHP